MKGKNICIETLRLTYLPVRLARTVLVRFPRRIHRKPRDAYVLDTVEHLDLNFDVFVAISKRKSFR